MDTDIAKYPTEDLEDGELTDSDDGYTPLQRPETNKVVEQPPSNSKMDESASVEDSISESDASTDSSSDSADVLKRPAVDSMKMRKVKKPRFALRVKSLETIQNRPKKYNIWTASIQEESLMENMRGFDVAKDPRNDRSVENYDYSLKYRLNGENRLKRRLPTSSGNNQYDDGYHQSSKKTKFCGSNDRRDRRVSASSSSTHETQNTPRHILDLIVGPDSEGEDVARDIANKLYEDKDDLLLRVVEVLGNDIPIDLFKETQKIEKDGGMMIINGKRRRTPGGVFLFLLKHHDKVSDSDKKSIFEGEVKKSAQDRKILQASKRDQKVEELKKRLNLQDKELKPLSSRASQISISHLKPESNGTLSNPPPSPVANGAQESSPDYSSQPINHVNDNSPEKAIVRDLEDDSLTAYDDDYLDMHCDEMDLF